MQPINLRSFNQKVRHHKKAFKKYLSKVEKNPPKNINAIVDKVNTEVWQEIDCITCANCCKKMTPTFTIKDIKSIAIHFDMTPKEVKEKWLHQDKKNGDWINVNQPCQFLNLESNMCSIYEVRPADCSGFASPSLMLTRVCTDHDWPNSTSGKSAQTMGAASR